MDLKEFKHVDVFPTRIHVAENFLYKEEFEKVKELVQEDKKHLDIPDFERKVMMHMGLICDNLGIDISCYNQVEITETWGNVLEEHQDHPIHTHSNHVFSGVFYLTTGNPTVFMDPRPAADCFSFTTKDSFNDFYGGTITSSAVPNNLILFPSWLSHMVLANKTNVVRKSISFNIILRGKYGNRDSRQEVML